MLRRQRPEGPGRGSEGAQAGKGGKKRVICVLHVGPLCWPTCGINGTACTRARMSLKAPLTFFSPRGDGLGPSFPLSRQFRLNTRAVTTLQPLLTDESLQPKKQVLPPKIQALIKQQAIIKITKALNAVVIFKYLF